MILPEMDIQLAVPNIDFPLLKALAPAIAVLTGNICAEHGLFLGGKRRIRNIKQYLLAALYNAPLTIENYYAAQIDHDLCGRN